MAAKELIVEQLKTRLDKYLAQQLPEISRSQIQRDILGGQVEVNGEIITESKFVVRLNDSIKYQLSSIKREAIKPTNTPLKVLYSDHGLLIIDKPAGLVVHPGAGFKGETLASALLYRFKGIKLVGEEGRSGIVHRLDKDTSGVILVATTPEMYEYLKEAFAERKIKKEYLALVWGRVEKPHGFIDTPIGKSKADFRKYDTKNMIQAKEALTEYKVLEYLTLPSSVPTNRDALSPGQTGTLPQRGREIMSAGRVDTASLLLVKLHTGRTHQIRVHFKSIGHPLMGDKLYGSKKTKLEGLNRQFLHAKKIEVQLPASPGGSQGGPNKTWIEAESELAEDLSKVLKELNSKVVNQL